MSEADEAISLDNYLANERKRLDEFERQWREGMAQKPHAFPASMDEGLWFEAYTSFDEGVDMVAGAPSGPEE